MTTIKDLIAQKDFSAIEKALNENPALANEGIPFDDNNTATAHPLHRICDGVYSKSCTEEEAIRMVKIFLDHGAKINGTDVPENKDSPLTAAASLNADQVAMFFIGQGADIHHAGCHGGTALHWAAWCGRPVLVKRLIQEGAAVNRLCKDFKSTPLFWAVHGWNSSENPDPENYLEIISVLIENGADKSIPNFEGFTVHDIIKRYLPGYLHVLS